MAGNGIYSLYPCQLNGATNLRQLGGVDISPNIERRRIVPAGAVDVAALITMRATPVVNIRTPDLTTLLGAISGTDGLNCTSASTFFFQQREDGSTFASGSSHVKFTAPIGKASLRNISVSDGPAIASVLFQPLYNGSTEPLLATTGQALGASTPTFTSEYYRGFVKCGSTTLSGVQSYEIDYGLGIVERYSDGDVWPTKTFVQSRTPTLRVTLDNAGHHSLITALSSGVSNGFTVYFLKGASGGTRAAAGNHVSISCSTGHWYPAGDSGDGNDITSHTFECEATSTLSTSTTATVS